MKSKLLLLLLLLPVMANAQIVNIPDVNFKNYLLNGYLWQPSIDTNNDGEIQLTEAQSITTLLVFEHPTNTGNIASLQGIEAFTNLTSLQLIVTVEDINLSGLSNLTNLKIENNNVLTTLNLSGLSNLKDLTISMSALQALDVSALLNLEILRLTWMDSLTSLTIGNNPNFEGMWLTANNLPELDLSGCPNLSFLNVQLSTAGHNVYVNLKNGNPNHAPNHSAILNANYMGGPYKLYVCLDEGEIGNLSIAQNSLVSTYCSFTPGGNYNTIAGAFTYDSDANGCSASDLAQRNIKIAVNDGMQTGSAITNVDGNYSFYTQGGTFTLTPQFENSWFIATPATQTVTFADNNNNTATQNFCISPNGVHPDVEVVLVPVDGARPGFDSRYKIVYKNKGNQTLSGAVSLTYDDTVLDCVSAMPAYTTSATGNLTWNYANLLPFESRTVNVTFNLNGPMETPPVNNGDFLEYTVAITPAAGDETPADNTFTFNQEVVGSFDPNDITCLEGETVHPDKIGQYLHYNINFENTGTAPATFIVVKDMINTQQFDVNSLQVLNASHNVETRVTGNKVEFIFDDINLGAEGKGNVVFKIKTLPTVAVNSTVTQKADIFFDYNWPIETNDANTTFTILSRGDFATDSSVRIYPNPAKDVVTVAGSAELKSIQLYDVQGRLLQSVAASGLQSSVNVSSLPKGIYFVKAFTEKGTKLEKIIKE